MTGGPSRGGATLSERRRRQKPDTGTLISALNKRHQDPDYRPPWMGRHVVRHSLLQGRHGRRGDAGGTQVRTRRPLRGRGGGGTPGALLLASFGAFSTRFFKLKLVVFFLPAPGCLFTRKGVYICFDMIC